MELFAGCFSWCVMTVPGAGTRFRIDAVSRLLDTVSMFMRGAGSPVPFFSSSDPRPPGDQSAADVSATPVARLSEGIVVAVFCGDFDRKQLQKLAPLQHMDEIHQILVARP